MSASWFGLAAAVVGKLMSNPQKLQDNPSAMSECHKNTWTIQSKGRTLHGILISTDQTVKPLDYCKPDSQSVLLKNKNL